MRIADMLAADGPTFSFEFFPPKDDEGAERLKRSIQYLAKLEPSFVSVTYGAGGTTRRRTVDLVKRIKDDSGLSAMAHLTCVGATRDEIASVLDELRDAGIQNILALRGDPPKGEEEFQAPEGGFRYASELTEFIKSNYDFCVGGACYPEKHQECKSFEQDLDHLKMKVDAGAEFLITQLFFHNEDFFFFRDRAVEAGIDVPIIAGIMPILNGPSIRRFTDMCGASLPAHLMHKIELAGDDPGAVRAIGVEHAWQQCDELLRSGVAGIHFYTLNYSKATREIYQRLKQSPETAPQAPTAAG